MVIFNARLSLSLLAGGLVGFSTVLVAIPAQAITAPITITLRSLNPNGAEGAGFGVELMGATSTLNVTLQAPQDGQAQITESTIRSAGWGFWTPSDSKPYLPAGSLTYQAYGIRRNEDHSVGFNGKLGWPQVVVGVGGTGTPPAFDVAVADLRIEEHKINDGDSGGLGIMASGSGKMTLTVTPRWVGPSHPTYVGYVTFSVTGNGITGLYDGANQVWPGNGIPVQANGFGDKQVEIRTDANFTSSATITATFTWNQDLRASTYTAVDYLCVVPNTLKVIDAQAFSPNCTPGITDNPTTDVSPSWDRSGVFADGTSVLIIRTLTERLNDVTFEVKHNEDPNVFPQTTEFVGSLSVAFPGLPAPNAGGGNRDATTDYDKPKVVYYRPPNNFLFGCGKRMEPLTIIAKVLGDEVARAQINLVRPTLALNHGFISGPAKSMTQMTSMLRQGTGVRIIWLDWSDINTTGYGYGGTPEVSHDCAPQRLFQKIADEVNFQRAGGIAATRVDFFGHSMGGTIVKWYASNLGYVYWPRGRYSFPDLVWRGDLCQFIRTDNFGMGDVHRLVTVGSPFRGSPIAERLSAGPFGQGGGYAVLKPILDAAHVKPDYTAIDDLGTASFATATVLRWWHPQVSWSPIVSIGAGPPPPDRTEQQLYPGGTPVQWSIARLLHWLNVAPHDLGLVANNSDFVVEMYSQMDCVPSDDPDNLPGHWTCRKCIHTDETLTGEVAIDAKCVLDLWFPDPTAQGYYRGYERCNSSF